MRSRSACSLSTPTWAWPIFRLRSRRASRPAVAARGRRSRGLRCRLPRPCSGGRPPASDAGPGRPRHPSGFDRVVRRKWVAAAHGTGTWTASRARLGGGTRTPPPPQRARGSLFSVPRGPSLGCHRHRTPIEAPPGRGKLGTDPCSRSSGGTSGGTGARKTLRLARGAGGLVARRRLGRERIQSPCMKGRYGAILSL